MSTRTWLLLIVTAAAAALGAGCAALECGEGTHEADGECVPGNGFDNTDCGPGTVLQDGVCKPQDPTICDPATTQAVIDPETGVITCVGQGGGCDQPLSCIGDNDPAKEKVCGRLYDVQTDAQIRAPGTPAGIQCGEDGAIATGPCQLQIAFYDALGFANGDRTELSNDGVYIDDCGRYRATNIQHPNTGFMGIGVDDADGEADTHRLTGVAFPVGQGDLVNNVKTYSVTVATDDDWSNDINFGTNTLVDRGAFVSIFLHEGTPAAGVTVTRAGSPVAGNDYYMDDVDPTMRTSVSTSQSVTGPNGIAIITDIGAGVTLYSGTPDPDGCFWPDDQAAAPLEVMFVNERISQSAAGPSNENLECQ